MIVLAERLGAGPPGSAAYSGARINTHLSLGFDMRDADLFQLALGISSLWFVKAADFNAELKRLDTLGVITYDH